MSKVIALPIVAALAIFLAVIFGNYSPYSIWVFLPVVLLTALYVFHAQIDYWYLTKHPLPIDGQLKEWMIKYQPYYGQLNDDKRQIFDQRLMLYIEAREFKSVGTSELRDVPFDVSGALASQAIRLTLHEKDFLIGDLDRIYNYKHAFPSPKHQILHTVEVDDEDGMLILSLEHALPGIIQPGNFFNICLYGYSCAYHHLGRVPNIEANEADWTRLERVIGINRSKIEQTVGLIPINMTALHVTAFFDHMDQYIELFIENYHLLYSHFIADI